MATFNVSGHGHLAPVYDGPKETLNMNGLTYMMVPVGGNASPDITVNISYEWVGGFTQNPGSHLTVTGRGIWDSSTTSTANGTTTIDVNVVGPGTINEFQSHSTGKLEFLHSVAATQTVTDSGYELYGGEFGTVQIDDPLNYHAQTKLGFGEIILEGLKATSYSLKPDLLSLYRGNVLVDQMRLEFMGTPVALGTNVHGVTTPTNFGVSQVGSSVVIHADGTSYRDGGRLLPVHG